MDPQSILSLGLLGAAFGGLLAFASQQFKVEVDPRITEVLEVLPGANCGACGFAGCAALAEAIVTAGAPPNSCPVGGSSVAGLISAIMGVEQPEFSHRHVAHVYCQKGCHERAEYHGIATCKAANETAGGPQSCLWACLGLGDCVHACPFGALRLDEKGLAVVNEEKCQSCAVCVATCPRHIIGMVPDHWAVHVDCSSQERGAAVRQTGCFTGCLACGQCERICPFKAVHVMGEAEAKEKVAKTRAVKSLAVIDYELCHECGLCASRCPTHAIKLELEKAHGVVEITDLCIGCGNCSTNCPVHAVSGELNQLHQVDPAKCVGCGFCLENCPVNAIIRHSLS